MSRPSVDVGLEYIGKGNNERGLEARSQSFMEPPS